MRAETFALSNLNGLRREASGGVLAETIAGSARKL